MTDDAGEVAGKTKDDSLTAAGGIAAAAIAADAAALEVGTCWIQW